MLNLFWICWLRVWFYSCQLLVGCYWVRSFWEWVNSTLGDAKHNCVEKTKPSRVIGICDDPQRRRSNNIRSEDDAATRRRRSLGGDGERELSTAERGFLFASNLLAPVRPRLRPRLRPNGRIAHDIGAPVGLTGTHATCVTCDKRDTTCSGASSCRTPRWV